MEISDEPVVLSDPSTGLLFYCVLFEGKDDNPMDLRQFPFDKDALEVHFTSTSDSVALDGRPRQQATDFVFRPVNPSRGMLQVDPEWDGGLLEFKLTGYVSFRGADSARERARHARPAIPPRTFPPLTAVRARD